MLLKVVTVGFWLGVAFLVLVAVGVALGWVRIVSPAPGPVVPTPSAPRGLA